MGSHPVVVEAAHEAAVQMGAGAGGTRNISGTSPTHEALEAERADLHGKEAALLFTSGHVAKGGAVHHPQFIAGLAGVFRRQEPRLNDRRDQGREGDLPHLPPQ